LSSVKGAGGGVVSRPEKYNLFKLKSATFRKTYRFFFKTDQKESTITINTGLKSRLKKLYLIKKNETPTHRYLSRIPSSG
ncbi:hypothetical protein ACVGW3_00500, partial [Enterobacter hormaechei]